MGTHLTTDSSASIQLVVRFPWRIRRRVSKHAPKTSFSRGCSQLLLNLSKAAITTTQHRSTELVGWVSRRFNGRLLCISIRLPLSF